MRLGIGGGGIFSTVKDGNKVLPDDATLSTGGVALELAFGGTPLPGFVIGGGIYGISTASQPTVKRGSASSTIDRATVSMLGLFVDWYPNPKDGWHVQGAVGPTRVLFTGTDGDLSGTGFGAILGGGYEWFVSEQWSVGILARVQLATPMLSYTSGAYTTQKYDSTTWSPALMFGATYH